MSNPFDCITDFIFVETDVKPADVILVPGSNHPPLMEKAASLYHQAFLVCKAGHARRALLSYQTVFSKNTEFFISPVVDRFGITKENWFKSEVGITRIMSEVEKMENIWAPRFRNGLIVRTSLFGEEKLSDNT